MANVDAHNENIDSVREHTTTTPLNPFCQVNYNNVNCLDINGDLNHGVCDLLPNNNECKEMCLSQCYSDKECISSPPNNVMSSENTISSPEERNSSSQESGTYSVYATETDASSKEEPELNEDACSTASSSSQNAVGTASEYHEYGEFSPQDGNNGTFKKNRKESKASKKSIAGARGRPRKSLIPMYHSQISGDKNTIKIRIRKSNLTAQVPLNPNKKKSGRRKRQKTKSDTDLSDYETSNKYRRFTNQSANDRAANEEPEEQSVWGQSVPYEVLLRIFRNLCVQEGCLPILVRLCKVCKLWRDVALSPSLWYKVDLNWVPDKLRTDITFHWLIQNRLTSCRELNLGEWKVRNVQLALEAISIHCTELRSLNLSGWKGLNADHLKNIATDCQKLERLDLSSINPTSTVNCQPLVTLAQLMGSRLTHLNLAHNKISGFGQIMAAIYVNCPNLELLDISNIRTISNTALLQVEKFQIGCPKLRVLRITNSQLFLAPATLTEQMSSPGFPSLEELSVAGREKLTTSYSLDDEGIERLLKNSTKLRLLDVRGCIRLSDSGLVRVPAWDLEHLFLSGCCITRAGTGLELVVQKWSHSLREVDLAWSTATSALDEAVTALTERGPESPLRTLNLCGSSVSLEPVKAVLLNCPHLHSINLQSCRALPRGIKRLYTGNAVSELRVSFRDKPKTESGEQDVEMPPSEKSVSV